MFNFSLKEKLIKCVRNYGCMQDGGIITKTYPCQVFPDFFEKISASSGRGDVMLQSSSPQMLSSMKGKQIEPGWLPCLHAVWLFWSVHCPGLLPSHVCRPNSGRPRQTIHVVCINLIFLRRGCRCIA